MKEVRGEEKWRLGKVVVREDAEEEIHNSEARLQVQYCYNVHIEVLVNVHLYILFTNIYV
jgi:hypothetical protein